MQSDAKDNVVAIRYSRPVGALGASESLELRRDGASSLRLTFNYDQRSEIGVWSHGLPLETFEQALSRLRASGYERLPVAGPQLPGMVAEVFGEQRQGEERPRERAFMPPPPELRDVTLYLLETMRELRAHPFRVLSGQARWRGQSSPPGCAAIDLTLASAGVEPLQVSNPLHGPAAQWSGLRLVLAAQGNENSVDLTPGDLRAPSSPSTRALRLAPGETFALQACAPLPVKPGTYQARLQVHDLSGASARHPERIEGMLWLDLGAVQVAR